MADNPFTANALADYIRRLFHVESGGNPNAVTGSNRGLGQWGHTEERRYGITDANRRDYGAQAAAVAREYTENNARLARALGRAPTFADHYLTHQQGVAGGPALLGANPQAPAWQVIRPFYSSYEGRRSGGVPRSADWWAQKAITGNIPSDSPLRRIPVDQISAGGFTGLWRDRFNRGLTRVGLSGEAPPVSAEAGPVSPALQNAMQSSQAAGDQALAPQAAGNQALAPLPSQAAGDQALAPPMPAPIDVAAPPGGVASASAQSPLAPPVSGVQSLLAGLGSQDNKGTGTLGDIGKSLMAAAGKTKGLPFPDAAKLKPFDENIRPLPLNLPNNFAAMAQIPKFAEGGIVDRPTVAMVGENGPEAIVPLAGHHFDYDNPSNIGFMRFLQSIPSQELNAEPSKNIEHGKTSNIILDHILALFRERAAAKASSWFHATNELENWRDPASARMMRAVGEPDVANWPGRGLPKLAEGGIVDKPTVAMVGEDGPEAIVPLSRNAGGPYSYMGMLEQAGRFMPPVDLPGQAPSTNIIRDTVDPFERAAARTRAPYARANERVSGLPDFIDYLRNRVVSVAQAPLDALTGRLQVSDPATGMPTPEAMQRGQAVAGMAMTGAIPFAQRGSAGIFGGQLARGANLSELEVAKTFAEHGAHPDDIWKSTGWFQGADAKWRHEIPDTSAKFNQNPPVSGKLPDLLTEHPLLYAAYPQLKDANFKIVPGGEGASYLGKFNNEHTFRFGEKALNTDPSVILHEVQHAVQGEEGFAKGGSVEQGPYESPFEADLRKLRDERDEIYRKYKSALNRPPEVADRLKYINKVTSTNFRLQDAYAEEAFKNYQRLAGEVEARNVQERYIPGSVPNTHPQLSESFPRSEQIPSPFPMRAGPKAAGLPGRMVPIEGRPRGFDPFRLQR